MRSQPPLCVAPRASRVAIAAIVLAFAATATLAALLPVEPAVAATLAAFAIHAACLAVLRIAGPSSPQHLRVHPDRRIDVTARNGHTIRGEVIGDSYVGERLTTIVWQPEGGRLPRTLLLVSDSLPAEDLRRLRVVLRYARPAEPREGSSDVAAG